MLKVRSTYVFSITLLAIALRHWIRLRLSVNLEKMLNLNKNCVIYLFNFKQTLGDLTDSALQIRALELCQLHC